MITSTSNAKIKEIRKLKDKKFRTETGLFFLEGIRIVIEALGTTDSVAELIVAPDLLDNPKAIEEVSNASKKGIPILEVSKEVFESISGKDGPQGLAAVARQKWLDANDITVLSQGVWIALYQVADPGNLGTILRTLDGMSGKGVILLDHCTDPFDPSAIRASMGTIFSKKLVKLTVNEFVSWIKKSRVKTIGTSDTAKMDFRACAYQPNMVLLMGSEREGLPQELTEICDSMVSIPMMGSADSLNLAVASSIVLYQIASQLELIHR